jgi:multidrug efflux pump subunit AcrA (membrane-fusion protein)
MEPKVANNKRRMRRVALLLTGVVAIGAAVFLVGMQRDGSRQVPTFAGATAKQMTETPYVEVSGNVEVIREADLAFPIAGTVAGISVPEGSAVRAGQALATLENSSQRYQLAYTEKQLEEAEISGTPREVAVLELERELRATDLEDTRLRAPFDGIVSEIDIDVGDFVAAGAIVVRVVDASRILAVLEVDEIDLPDIQLDQTVDFTFDALDEFVATGTLTYIPTEARITSQGLAMFDVEAVIEQPGDLIRPGYSFVAKIITGDTRELVWLPREAVQEQNGRNFVLVDDHESEHPKLLPVTVAAMDSGDLEITSGLAAGQEVLIPQTAREEGAAGQAGFMSGLLQGPGGGPGGGGPGAGGPGGGP